MCTHVCTRAYIRGLRSLRQSINTHDATGEAGRRVRVSQRITPLLSLHLSPFQSSISPSFLLLQLDNNCNCSRSYAASFLREKPRGKTLTSGWRKMLFYKTRGSVNKTRQPIGPSQRAAFETVVVWHWGFQKIQRSENHILKLLLYTACTINLMRFHSFSFDHLPFTCSWVFTSSFRVYL